MKKLSLLLIILGIILTSIYGYNHFKLQKIMNDVISSDYRNTGIKVKTNYEIFINTEILIYNLTQISSDKSMADVFRVFLQFAEKTASSKFSKVVFAYSGKKKFYVNGEYYNKLGKEFNFQNPVYTTRTFPVNLYNLDGTKPYPGWTGGLFGVVGKQVEDFKDFHKQWYLNELTNVYLNSI